MELLDFLEHNGIEFKLKQSLSNYTNFKIGGECPVMVFPSSISKFVRLLKFLNESNIKFYVLSAGTNILCSDNGYDGVIIKLGGKLKNYKLAGNRIFAEAGMNLFELNRILLEHSLSGLEFSYGIPGSVGGAVCMNAGAYGKSVGDYIVNVKVFDGHKIRTLSKSEMKFSYRHSVVFEKHYIVLGATFLLDNGVYENIKQSQQQFLTKRLETQPYHEASAGSVFKRLENGVTPVSKMIDELGLKGYSVGDAQISTIHAGFIVNKGKASCNDVKNLIKYVQSRVKASYNEDIELEIVLLGENWWF